MFDFEASKARLLAHYVALAAVPGAKAQAWHSVNTLAQQYPSLYGDLPDLLVAAMKERSDAQVPQHENRD